MDNSQLSRLPAELRTAIYDLVLHHPSGICIEIDQGDLKLNSPAPASQPLALLATCHQIRSESIAVFWRNHFRFTVWAFNDVLEPREIQQAEALGDRWPQILRRWLESIGPGWGLMETIDLDLGFWNTARREVNDFSQQYVAPQLHNLRRLHDGVSSLRLTAYILVSYNVNSHCLWGLRTGLGEEDLKLAMASIRAGEFEHQRSIVCKDDRLASGVCVYGYHGKKVYPATRTALLRMIEAIQSGSGTVSDTE